MPTITASVLLTEANAATTAMLGSYVVPLAERVVEDVYPLISLILNV